MNVQMLREAVATVPPGNWAVGVSGGADSVALLLLLKERSDLSLHVAHMDHQTRGGESAVDAGFVACLAEKLVLPYAIGNRSDVESVMPALEKNTSSRFRSARFAFFRQLIGTENLRGVLLAHHADDQAETVLQRLLRGAGPAGLAGMMPTSTVQGLKIMRPLLRINSSQLRDYLRSQSQTWREDSSNRSMVYQRNRLRMWLRNNPGLREHLLNLQGASSKLRIFLERNAPILPDIFSTRALAELPQPIARRSACRWLMSHGVPPDEMSDAIADRLIEMASDAASAPRSDFPRSLRVCRRQGNIFSLAHGRPVHV